MSHAAGPFREVAAPRRPPGRFRWLASAARWVAAGAATVLLLVFWRAGPPDWDDGV